MTKVVGSHFHTEQEIVLEVNVKLMNLVKGTLNFVTAEYLHIVSVSSTAGSIRVFVYGQGARAFNS